MYEHNAIENTLEICRWLMSFNDIEKTHRIKCYRTGGNKPDVRFCIDRGYDCSGSKIMTGFVVIEPDYALMGLYSNNPNACKYFKTDTAKRWRINSSDVLELPIAIIRDHILESYCIKIKELGLDSVMCNRKDSISRPMWPQQEHPNGSFLPNKDDFDVAYRSLAKPGQEVSIDIVLDQIEHNVKKAGHNLKENWRMITERNIRDIWSKG